jgi:hypothetical protein
LKSDISKHGFSSESGWKYKSVDVDNLFEAFANHYLSEKSWAQAMSEQDVGDNLAEKEIESLTFCPNILFANFPNLFTEKPCSRPFQSAILLADISGFSKFSAEMCLRGAKGLDVLHRVTNDFLGYLVHTVYDFDGDGKLFLNDAL